jgi:Fe(3+) dicitrate transport protein
MKTRILHSIILFFLILGSPLLGQDKIFPETQLSPVESGQSNLLGTVTDKNGIPLEGVYIHNISNKKIAHTDHHGNFLIHANPLDEIEFKFDGFQSIIHLVTAIDIQNKLKIALPGQINDISEIRIINKRMEHFDVGTLPPIRGVQITTGTNAVIELENSSGAKSTANPREMFAKIPGLNIWESDGAGIQIGIGGRGLSPNRAANFNTRQNGYDISADALGYPESYYTPPFEALKSIEITRGSASLQFGTQFGGLLNFIIREAPTTTPLEITSRTTIGKYGYFGTFNRIAGTENKLSYQVYHQYKSGNGYRANSNFNQTQLFGQLAYYFTENIRLKLEFTHMDYLAQQAGGLSDFQFNEDDRQSVRERNWFQVNWNMAALHFDYEISRTSHFNLRAFGMQSSRESLGFLGKITQADPGGNREMIQGLFQNGGVEARYLKKYNLTSSDSKRRVRGAFLIGSRAYQGFTTNNQGTATAGSDANFKFQNPDDLEGSSFQFPSQNLAAFIENILFVGKKLWFNCGVRYEYISSSSTGFYKKYSIHPMNFDTLGVYKIQDQNTVLRKVPLVGLGASYKLKTQSSVYVNFTQNYRAINFTDIRVNNPNIVVDTLIKDEHGYTGEIGFRGMEKKYFIYDIAGFYVYYGDKIGLAPKPGTTYKERTNIGDAVNIGIELFTEFDFLLALKDSTKHNLSMFVNFAYIHTEYIRSKEPNYIHKKVEYVSPIILKSGLKWKYKGWMTQIQASYNSAQFSDASNAIEPSGDAVIGLVPSYLILDFSSRYQINDFIQLETGVNNLTNQKYFTRRATAYPGPGILPSDGINIYLTAQFKIRVKK